MVFSLLYTSTVLRLSLSVYALTQDPSKFTNPRLFRFSSSLANELLEMTELEYLALAELDETTTALEDLVAFVLETVELELIIELVILELEDSIDEEPMELDDIADKLAFDFS